MRIKSFFLHIFLSCVFLFFGGVSFAKADSIEQFDVKAQLATNGTLTVHERITYSFDQDAVHHGILRSIPVRYQRFGFPYDLHLEVLRVTADQVPTQWQADRINNNLVIKIGSKDQTVEGTHVYDIEYTTSRAINHFSDHDELYWNVTGNGWLAPIKNSTFSFAGAPVNKTMCYTGVKGSSLSLCAFEKVTSSQPLQAKILRPLLSHEGWSVVLSFPPSTYPKESFSKQAFYALRDSGWSLLPYGLALLMLGVWLVFGRDPRGRGIVIPQYETPDNVSPGIMAALMDQSVYERTFASMLIDLARRGFVRFRFEGEDPKEQKITIKRTETTSHGKPLTDIETRFLDALLKGKESVRLGTPATQNQAAQFMKLKDDISADMMKRGWFRHDPELVRYLWVGGAIALGFISYFFDSISLFFLALVVGFVGWNMPRVTKKGAIAVEHALGLKLYLTVAEKKRLAFSDAPSMTPERFAEYLPAAIALGVEKEWLKQFSGMTLPAPEYIDGIATQWSATILSVQLGRFISQIGITAISLPGGGAGGGSSGFSGGSSGGGFGGGGGGSW